jgi:hypothetical protein
MSPHTIRYRNVLYRYYRCRSTAGGRKPCGHQVSASIIEASLLEHIDVLYGLNAKQIPEHVENVIYDYRDQGIRVKLKPSSEAEAESDSAELAVPAEMGKP